MQRRPKALCFRYTGLGCATARFDGACGIHRASSQSGIDGSAADLGDGTWRCAAPASPPLTTAEPRTPASGGLMAALRNLPGDATITPSGPRSSRCLSPSTWRWTNSYGSILCASADIPFFHHCPAALANCPPCRGGPQPRQLCRSATLGGGGDDFPRGADLNVRH